MRRTVRVLYDPGASGLSRFPALFTLFRIGQRLLVGAFADTETLQAHRQAGVVHHGETCRLSRRALRPPGNRERRRCRRNSLTQVGLL